MNAQHTLHALPSAGRVQATPQSAAQVPSQASARERDLRIIGEHLRKASQSHRLATRLHAQGLSVDAEQQTRLTDVFLQNALCRIKTKVPHHSDYPS